MSLRPCGTAAAYGSSVRIRCTADIPLVDIIAFDPSRFLHTAVDVKYVRTHSTRYVAAAPARRLQLELSRAQVV